MSERPYSPQDVTLSNQMASEGCPNTAEEFVAPGVVYDALDVRLSNQMVSEGSPNYQPLPDEAPKP